MGALKFRIDTSKAQAQIEQMYKRLSKDQIPAACSAAINRTLTEGRTSIVRALSNEVTLKVGSVREVVNIAKVNKADVAGGKAGSITLSDSPRPLYDFPNNGKIGRAPKRGISVRVRKRKPPEKFRHWFVAKMKSGHVGIFGRAKGRDKSGGKFNFSNGRGQKRFMYTGGKTSAGSMRSGAATKPLTWYDATGKKQVTHIPVAGKKKVKRLSGAGYARRLPIEEAFGPAITNVFANAGTLAQQEVDKLGESLAKNIKSQIARFTKPKKA